MVDITFLEINVQEPSATATIGDDEAEEAVAFDAADESVPPASGRSNRAAVVAALVGLVFLAVVAYLAKRRFLDEEEEEYAYDDYE
jgi:cytochrome c-type biogenesis protein CcmH/NrfG